MATGPLSSLYDDKFGIAQLVYPEDLGSARKGHWITFNISVPTKSTYNTTQTPYSLLSDVSGMISSAAQGVSSVFSSLGDGFTKSLTDFMYQYTVSPGTTKQVASISLYTPDTISIVQNAHYNNASLTETLGMLGYGAAAGSTIVSAFDENASIGNSIRGLGIEQAVRQLAGESNDNAVGIALKTQGMAQNPQMEVLFTNMDFRKFQFDFLFTPKNENEAANVRAIIEAFKIHSAPEIDEPTGGRYFIVPSVFDIAIYFNGNVNTNVHKFAMAALQTVVVDYAPQGWITHEDGMPVQTRLTLQFQEMEIMTKQKIKDKGY